MNEQKPDLLEATLEQARRAPIDHDLPGDIVHRALDEARVERRIREARRHRFLAGAAVAAALLGVLSLHLHSASLPSAEKSQARAVQDAPRQPMAGPTPMPAETRLPGGDRLLSSPEATFEVRSSDAHRVVVLDSGDMLYDVAHDPNGSFTVEAGGYRVEVLGTVFSVFRQGGELAVRVFDGTVALHQPGARAHRLIAGELWASSGIEGLDAWRRRSEAQWRMVAPEGTRAPGRARPMPAAETHAASPATEQRHPAREAPANAHAAEPSPVAPTLDDARRALDLGDFEGLLAMSDAHPNEGRWLLLRGDALRGLRRFDEGAAAYEGAAQRLEGRKRVQAAFAAAQLQTQRDPRAALALLQTYGTSADGSALEERSRALEIEVLRQLGRDAEADAAEREYARRFATEATATSAPVER